MISPPATPGAAPAGAAPVRADPRMRPARVRRVHRETADTVTLALEPPDGSAGFAFLPGQFNMVYAFGIGEAPISISGDPDEPSSLVHTVRNVGAVSRAIVTARPGAHLGVRGPFGAPWPLEAAEGNDVLVIAGGIGLAPLRPALLRLLARRERYGRVVLLYGARTPEELLFPDEVARWRARLDAQVEVTVDRAAPAWRGNVGVVTRLLASARFDPESTVAFICGPEIMMRFTARELLDRELPADRIWLSMERNMKCGAGHCGHCQFGPFFVCRDGPVFRYDRAEWLMAVREI